MTTFGLISCASRKQGQTSRAEEMYVSTLFSLSRAYVQEHCDRWFILSAKHHLLAPDDLIDPYDLTLNRMRATDRLRWAAAVWEQLSAHVSAGDRVVLVAGRRYFEHLLAYLAAARVSVDRPTAGLPIGKSLQWLKANTHGMRD